MAKKRIERKIDTEAGTVTFTELSSAETFVADFAAMYGDLWPMMNEIQKRLILHGGNAKDGDSAADPTNPAIPQIAATHINMVGGGAGNGSDGVWSSRGDGTGGVKQTDLASAVFAVMVAQGDDTTQEKVNEAVSAWDDTKKKDVRGDPRIKKEIEKLKKARQDERTKAADKAAKATSAESGPLTL